MELNKTQIKAEIVADSTNPQNDRLTSVLVTMPRIILSEMNTHRALSKNTSSCLTGDTKITVEKPSSLLKGQRCNHQNITIEELCKKWFYGDSKGRDMKNRIKQMKLRCLNEETGEFTTTNITNCFIQGINDVYEIELNNGYKIKCTENHRIYTNEGWKTLKEININHNNGITSYDKHSFKVCTNGLNVTKEWLEEQKKLGKNLTQICDENDLNFKSLSVLSEKFGIYWRKKVLIDENTQYKNKEWLQKKLEEGLFSTEIALICNSTVDRIKKQITKFNLKGNRYVWNSRKEVWNKNKRYNHKEESLINIRLAAKKRIKKNSWEKYRDLDSKIVRFLTEVRNELIEKGQFICAISKSPRNLHLHHIDPVWNNADRQFDKTNLIPLNKEIHRWLHSNNLDIEFLNYYNKEYDLSMFKELYKDLSLKCDEINKPKSKGNFLVPKYHNISKITYLGRQETFDIEVREPYHNFVANGIVVHNSRAIPFKKMVEAVENDPFIPIAWQKHHSGMQGNEYFTENDKASIIDGHFPDSLRELNRIWLESRNEAVKKATRLNKLGLTKQIVNRILEPFMWTTMLITGSKEGWDNFFELRCPKYQYTCEDGKVHYLKSRKEWVNMRGWCVDSEGNTWACPIENPKTELEWLQINKGQAEIHMMALAEKIYDAFNESTPKQLKSGQWHIPMIEVIED